MMGTERVTRRKRMNPDTDLSSHTVWGKKWDLRVRRNDGKAALASMMGWQSQAVKMG